MQSPPKFAPVVVSAPEMRSAPSQDAPGTPPATPQTPPPPPPPTPPDVIELKNGDKVTGTVGKMVDGKLVVTTSYAGDVTIAWKDVKTITLGRPLPIKLKSGDVVTGKLTTAGDGLYKIETEEVVGREAVAADAIVAINEPPPKWTGFVRLDGSVSQGNTETTFLAFSAEATHETKVDLFKIYVRSEYQDRDNDLTAQATTGGSLYDYYFTERVFSEIFVKLQHDHFQDLHLRTTVGASLGYAFVKEDDMRLTGDFGAAYIDEDFINAEDNQFVALKFGEAFNWTINDKQSISQALQVFPNTEMFKDTLVHFEATYRNLLTGGFFVDTTVIDDYDGVPAPGKKYNDFKFLISIGYKF